MAQAPTLLFVTNDLGIGGVQRIVVDFANRLSEDFEVSIVVLWDRPGSDFHISQLRPGIPVTTIGFTKFWDFAGWCRLYQFIHRGHFHIVFTQLFMADLFGRTAAFLAGTPVIVTEIQNLIPHFPKKYIQTDRALRSITDMCISTTPAITDYAREVIGYPAHKLVEVPTNAVDETRFTTVIDRAAIRESIGIPKNGRMILSVGRLVEQKGHTVLLKALPAILKEEPDAHIVIAGDGFLRESLEQEAQELGVADQVHLLGVRNDVPDLLRSADVFAFPSVYEGQGLILFETFFSRLPIVASDVGGIPDVIKHEETGLLVPPGEPAPLAVALLRIVADRQLGIRLAEEAFRRYGDRTVAQSAQKLATVFKHLLEIKRVIPPGKGNRI